MNQHSQKKTPDQMVEAIFALDLDPIKFKLMDKEEGYGWSRAQADRCEREYKRFLALLAKYPDEVIAPSKEVDKFWHGHILDTMKYAEDCRNVFGYFLHHFPYFGLRDEEDAANLARAAATMRRLYRQEFGAAPADEAGDEAGDKAGYCAKAASAYCARADVSYCARSAMQQSAYCARAAASYCARAAGGDTAAEQAATAADIVTAKGRPALAQRAAA